MSADMATWGEFAAAHLALAAFGAECLTRRPAYLATLTAEGQPRVHPVAPIISAQHLFLFMEPTSPRGHDLRERETPIDDPAVRASAAGAAGYQPAERYVLVEEPRCKGYGDVTLPAPPHWRRER